MFSACSGPINDLSFLSKKNKFIIIRRFYMITNGFAYLAFLVCFAGIVSSLERKYKDSTFFKYVPTP